MKEITSTTNETVKRVQKLHQKKYRRELGIFLLEGKKSVEEAIAVGFKPEALFVLKNSKLITEFNQYEITVVDEKVMQKLTSTETPPEIAAVAKQLKHSLDGFESFERIALYENIKDAGNLGTIIRCAAAFDIEGIILLGDTVDLYNPKLIRSSVGNFGKIPIAHCNSIDEILPKFQSHSFIATTLSEDSKSIKLVDFSSPFILMFGEEACGLSEKLQTTAQQKVKLEINPKVESLNLASASSIFFWEVFNNKK